MLSDDIDQVLRDYFAWAAAGDPSEIGYPHTDTVRRLLGSGVRALGMSDEEAIVVDFAMGQLKRHNEDAFNVLCRVYQDRKTLRWMARRGLGSRPTLQRLAGEGRQFIRGVVLGADFHAEKKWISHP